MFSPCVPCFLRDYMRPVLHAVHDLRRSLINDVPQMRDPLKGRRANFTHCQSHPANVLLGASFEGWEAEVFFDDILFMVIFQTRGLPVSVHQVDVSADVEVGIGRRQLLVHDAAQ